MPKLAPEERDRFMRLANDHDFQQLLKYEGALLDYYKDLLITCDAATVQFIQGRAAMLRELLELTRRK